jgi:hypothetical protein
MEVGSCIKLTFDGKFQYFLAYGAYDEDAEGTWRIDGGQVVLDSPAYDRRPTFAFKRKQRGESDAFDVIVESKAGRPMQGIDVSVTCDGRTVRAGVTGAEGFKIECTAAPTQVLLGLGMYGVALQTDRCLGPGRNGQRPMCSGSIRATSARSASPPSASPWKFGTSLTAVYADTPIRELAGRTFRYARQQQ